MFLGVRTQPRMLDFYIKLLSNSEVRLHIQFHPLNSKELAVAVSHTIIIGPASRRSSPGAPVLASNARYHDRQDAIEQGYRIASDSSCTRAERPSHLCQAFVLIIERRGSR